MPVSPPARSRRRLFARLPAVLPLLAACLAMAWAACLGGCGEPSEPPPSGLLVIGIDTLRADELGAYGSPHRLTPSLDALAAESYRFTDLSAPAPWTLPSFATLATGLAPETHGAGERLSRAERLRDVEFGRLDDRLPTLAGVLSDAGFDTAGFYSNPFLGPAFGLDRGFDEYRGFPPRARAEEVVDAALDWLRVRRDGGADAPFFAFVHLFDPHTPYTPPPSFCDTVAREVAEAPAPAGPQEAPLPCKLERPTRGDDLPPEMRPWARALYRAEVAYTDGQVGRLLEGLAELGLADDTVVLVTSDHGEAFWERPGLEEAGYHAVADHGNTLYRELIHVPGLLRVPGRAGAVVDRPASLADFFPTLLSLLGVEAPISQGHDLRAALGPADRAGSATAAEEAPLLLGGRMLYGEDRLSARRGPWKLITGPLRSDTGEEGGEAGGSRAELYDLAADPGERRNLAAERPRITEALARATGEEEARRAELRALLLSGDSAGRPAEMDEELREKLKALGYL